MVEYDYFCEKCDKPYVIEKISIKEWTGKDPCPTCNVIGYRVFSGKIEFSGTKIEDAEYNIGLGCITKSKRHRDELVKRKELIEVGNEDPNKIHSHFDKDREDRRKRSWENV